MTGYSIRRASRAICMAGAAALSACAYGQQNNFWNGGDGSWSDSSQWSTGQVPGVGDDVHINFGNVNLDVYAPTRSLTLDGGSLFCSGFFSNTVSIDTTFDFRGGTLAGGVRVYVNAYTDPGEYQTTIRNGVNLGGATLTASATLWASGDLRLTNGASSVFLSNTAFDIDANAGDVTVDPFSSGGDLTFDNFTTSTMSSVGTHTLNRSTIRNDGTLIVSSGMLTVGGINGDSGYSNGRIAVDDGATLSVNDFYSGGAASYAGDGTIVFSGNLTIESGHELYLFSPNAILGGAVTGGSLRTTNGLSILPGVTIDHSALIADSYGPNYFKTTPAASLQTTAISPFTVRNSAVSFTDVNWTGDGRILFDDDSDSPTSTLVFSKLFSLQGTGTQSIESFDPANVTALLRSTQDGTLAASGGGVYTVAVPFISRGAIRTEAGELRIFGGGTLGDSFGPGAINIAFGTTLNFGGAPYTFPDTLPITNVGTLLDSGQVSARAADLVGKHLILNGVELNLRGNLDTNQFTWTKGAVTGTGTTNLSTNLTFAGGSTDFATFGVGLGRTLDLNGHSLNINDFTAYESAAIETNVFAAADSVGTFLVGGAAGAASLNINTPFTLGTGDSSATVIRVATNGVVASNPGATETVTLRAGLFNAGTVTVSTGTLAVTGTGEGTGRITGAAGTTFALASRGNYTAHSGSVIDAPALRVDKAALTVEGNAVVTATDGITLFGGRLSVLGSTSFAGTSEIDVIGQGEDSSAVLSFGPLGFGPFATPPTVHAVAPAVPIVLSNGGQVFVQNAIVTAGSIITSPSNAGQVSVNGGTLTANTLALESGNLNLNSSVAAARVTVGTGTLSGVNAFVDGTFTAANLFVDGSLVALGDFNGNRSGVFGRTNATAALDLSTSVTYGTGTLRGSVTPGIISPGSDLPPLFNGQTPTRALAINVTGDFTLNDSSLVNIDLFVDGEHTVTYDAIHAAGTLTLGGVLEVWAVGDFNNLPGDRARYYIITATAGTPGQTAADIAYESDDEGRVVIHDYFGNLIGVAGIALDFDGVGQDGLYLFDVVPEPASAALLASAAMMLKRRRRRQ